MESDLEPSYKKQEYTENMSEAEKGLLALGHAVIKKARLSNAMGTPLVAIAIVTIPCLVIYLVTRFWPILIIAAVPVFYFVRAFDWLMRNHPELLRTEEHEERMLQISTGYGRKGKEVPESTIESLPETTAPQPRRITKTKSEGKK